MDTDYEALKTAVMSYPRIHLSMHGVETIEEAVKIISEITGEKPTVSLQPGTLALHGLLERAGTMTVFVTNKKKDSDGVV